jgi:hypothetical protein
MLEDMNAYPKVAILAVYFGSLPPWFSLWLKSCSYNPEFEWILFTDASLSAYQLPDNVSARHLTKVAFCEKLSKELECRVHFTRPYKVCDFKPLFWVLLQEEPKHYQFWGHCDLDMVFGDLGRFIDRRWFDLYDKLFSLGHFTLYRNDEPTNRMYLQPHPQWKSIDLLLDPSNHGFDEHHGVNELWKLHSKRFYDNECVMADIDPCISRFELVGRTNNYYTQVFFWENGKVFRGYYKGRKWCRQEFMYIHFQKRAFQLNEIRPNAKAFYMTPRGFIARDEGVPVKQQVRWLNAPAASTLSELKYRLSKKIKYYLS